MSDWRLVVWHGPYGDMPLCEERQWIVEDALTAPDGARLGEMVREQRAAPFVIDRAVVSSD
jgi:hypothetical protein